MESSSAQSTPRAGPDLFKARPDFILEEIAVRARLNVLSVDVECWEHIIRSDLTGSLQPPCRSCCGQAEHLLDIFEEAGVKATFFVLGIFAERFPHIVAKMDARGHEIAAHGYTHRQLFKLTAREFKEDLVKVVNVLSSIVGKPVIGYRAPAFSLDGRTPWAMEILAEHGIQYDSSIFPFSGRRYGIPNFPRKPVRILWSGGHIIEIPLSTVDICGRRLPVAGGGYFRLLPMSVIQWAVRRINQETTFVTYMHPYEFAPEHMRFGQFSPPISRWQAVFQGIRFNLFRRTMRRKLLTLLKTFPFAPAREVILDGLED